MQVADKVPADRDAAVSLLLEIARDIKDADHAPHGPAANLLNTAVMGQIFAAVRVCEHHMQIFVRGQNPPPVDLIGLKGGRTS